MSRSLSALRLGLLGVLLCVWTTSTWGQSSNGSVRGSVQDETRAVIPGATVVLTNTATNVESRTISNSAGLFVLPAVAPGPYRIAVEFSGMKSFEATLTVGVQRSETVDVILRPSDSKQVITVEDVTPMVTVDSQSLGHTLERARIEQLPINGRQITNLLWTVPGLTFDNDSGAIRTMGARQGTHDISLDGSALTDAVYGEKTVERQPSLETIQEFKVDINSVSAKYARQTNVIMTTKSGSNELHGSLFETNRDNGYGLARRREDGNAASKYIRNEYGGTIGGPVWIPKLYNGKNRTFFFFGYEGYKQRSGTTGAYRVPTEAMRNGDFSNLVDAAGTHLNIYNPFETNPVNFSRPQFAYQGVANRIDPALASPLWTNLMSEVPLPSRPDVNPMVANNYYGPKPDTNDQYTWSLRLDQRLGNNDQLYVRLTNSYFKRFRLAAGGVPTLGNSRTDEWPNKSIAVNWARTITPSLVNELTFSASRSTGGSFTGPENIEYASELGLPNPNNQIGYPVVNNIGVGRSQQLLSVGQRPSSGSTTSSWRTTRPRSPASMRSSTACICATTS